MNMTTDFFAEQPFGKIALQKMGEVPDNFRLYKAGWLGNKPQEWSVMDVTGAEFRVAKKGKYAGTLSVLVKGTARKVFVTKEEMQAFAQRKFEGGGDENEK